MSSKLLLLTCLATLTACGGGGSSSGPATQAGPTVQPPTQNPTPVNPPNTSTEIKLLGLMSTGLDDLYADPDLRLQHLVNVANDVLAGSNVDLNFVLEHVEVVTYSDAIDTSAALDDVTSGAAAAFTNVEQLRTLHSADLVVLFRPYSNDGFCGYAWLGGYATEGDFSNPAEADYGYSVVAANCDDYTLLHELGHNLGLAHSREEDPEGGTFAWALGVGQRNDFVTVMASPTEFNAPRLPKLSSPTLSCNGQPCGVAHTDTNHGADAVRTLNQVKDQIAAYR